jgi:hypothetical protein
MDDFAKQRSSLIAQMEARKKGEVFSDYISATRRKLETDGKITIYKDAVAKLDESDLPFGDLLNQ